MFICKRSRFEHIQYLEERFGSNISCECGNRTKLLIEFGTYALQNPEESEQCMYSCRQCQYDRMMKLSDCTFRL